MEDALASGHREKRHRVGSQGVEVAQILDEVLEVIAINIEAGRSESGSGQGCRPVVVVGLVISQAAGKGITRGSGDDFNVDEVGESAG